MISEYNIYFPTNLQIGNKINKYKINDSINFDFEFGFLPFNHGLYELNTINTNINYKILDKLNSGIEINALNNDLFNKYSISSGLSYTFFNSRFDVTFDYQMLKIKDFNVNNKLIINLDGSVIFDKMVFGFYLNNLTKSRFADSSFNVENFMQLYSKINILNNLNLTLGYFMEFASNTSFNLSIDNKFWDFVNLNVSYNMNPEILFVSFKTEPIKKCSFYSGFYYHSNYGIQQSYAVSFEL